MTYALQQVKAITNALSPVRMGTYQAARGFSKNTSPLDIYIWSALLSGAFFSTLHICEIVMRNGIAHALERKYGSSWPWSAGFEQTLIASSKNELQRARAKMPTGSAGKVVADLKFMFWCQMFTSRQDNHVWNKYLKEEFPYMPSEMPTTNAREYLYKQMNAVRLFRNRIAHHEPIFHYPLAEHHTRIRNLVRLRCGNTADWLAAWETVTAAIAAKP
jgi:hypothetical protein